MMTAVPSGWGVRGATFALWLLAAASLAYWGLKLTATPGPLRPAANAARVVSVDGDAVARVLGATASIPAAAFAAPELSSRFQLVGVAAGAHSGGGAAVIAVDGKPAKPFRVGSPVDDGLVLQSVHGRRAVLAQRMDGPAAVTLELPLLQARSAAPAPPGMVPPTAPVVVPPPPRPAARTTPPRSRSGLTGAGS